MRILEARDGFIKFESDKKVAISSFLHINGYSKQYVAQVIKMNCFDERFVGYAKILFVYDGLLKNYDKTLPALDSEIKPFAFDILSKSFETKDSVVVGKIIGENADIPMDRACLDKKLLICVDSANANNIITSNLAQQLSKTSNILVIDMLGVVEAPKFLAGVDFKLPLNTEALEFMFEDCLNDATSDSKSLIKEIFKDLSDYSKTVPFVPFGALKSIVDDMVDKSHIFKLLVLKNKLAKFDKMGYFAATVQEAENLNRILESKSAIIDLSKLDSIFQNRYLSVIYSALNKRKLNSTVFVEASNSLSKKNIKTILTSADIPAIFVTHSRFKYINEIKNMFENLIIEPSFTNNEIFKSYGTFLNSMQKDTYLVVGKGTNYLPLISKLELMEFEAEEIESSTDVSVEEFVDTEALANGYGLEFDVVKKGQPEEKNIQEEQEPSTEAIEKKSEELIEKVSEDIKETEVPQLFAEETEDNEEITEVGDTNLAEEVAQDVIDVPEDNELDEVAITQETAEEEPIETLEEISINGETTEVPLEESFEDSLSETVLDEQDLEEVSLPKQAEEVTFNELTEEPLAEEDLVEPQQEVVEEFHTNTDNSEVIEIPEEISDLTEETEIPEANNQEEEVAQEPEIIENEQVVIPVSDEDGSEEFGEIVELDDSEISDDDILVDLGEQEEDTQNLDEEIVKDVDKVFTTMKDDTISDSDLDFIDELNSGDEEAQLSDGMEELTELQPDEDDEGFLEPLEEVGNKHQEDSKEILEKREGTTPIVPVYDADIPQEDMVVSDSIEQGDTVVHAKYGTGVVEKMIKYGNKTLYSINFDNIGRRLLDPTLTEIKKA